MKFKVHKHLIAGLTAAVVGLGGLGVAPAQADPFKRLFPSDRAISGFFTKIERQNKRQKRYYHRQGVLGDREFYRQNNRAPRGTNLGFNLWEYQPIARNGAGAAWGIRNSYTHQGR